MLMRLRERGSQATTTAHGPAWSAVGAVAHPTAPPTILGTATAAPRSHVHDVESWDVPSPDNATSPVGCRAVPIPSETGALAVELGRIGRSRVDRADHVRPMSTR